MLHIKEIENSCYIYGSKDLLDEVQRDILTIVRDKEKETLPLFKTLAPGTISTSSKVQNLEIDSTSLKYSLSTFGAASIEIPAGLLSFLISELDAFGIEYQVQQDEKLPRQKVYDDLLYSGSDPITLRDYQVTSIRKAMTHKHGIFNIATGGGKTEIIIGIAKMVGSSLTIVPSKSSLKQTFARFKKRGLKDVGRYGGGHTELKTHTIATASMINSRLKLGELDIKKYLKSVKLLMFDEVHHLGTAPSWQRVGNECPAPRRYGFSGSPWASGMPSVDLTDSSLAKFADFRVTAQVGETLVYIPSKMLRDMGVIVDPRIYVIPVSEPQGLSRNPFPRWHWVYRNGIIENEHRNNLIVDASFELSKIGHKTTILVVSIPHGKKLLELLHLKGLKAAFTKGDDEVFVYTGKRVKSVKEAGEKYRDSFLDGTFDVLIGSVVMDEAVDLPGMSALILAGGMKSPIRAVQRIGRAIRTSDGKEEAIILDFRDRQHYFLNNHTNQRLKIYDAHEYDYTECEWDEFLGAL